jgi:hypothetical protein
MDLANPLALGLLVDLLAGQGSACFTVTGDSMRPFLAGSETVTLRRVRPAAIRWGDLLLCRQAEQAGGQLLLHRVVAVQRRRGLPALIQTQGDALWTPDEPVTESQVLGRVFAVLGAQGDAQPLRLDSRGQRLRALLIALRQRALWRVRPAYAGLRRTGASWVRPLVSRRRRSRRWHIETEEDAPSGR